MESAIKILGLLRINHLKSDINQLEKEIGRLDRCISYEYLISDEELSYEQFVKQFILTNYQELIYGTKYNSDYISKTDKCYEDNHIFYQEHNLQLNHG